MKNIIFVFFVLISLNSCYSTKFTHSQVMDSAVNGKNKNEIVRQFGIPKEKRVEGNFEEWVYDMGQRTVALDVPSTTRTSVKVSPSRANINSNYYGGGSISKTFNDYIKITFQGDQAIRWDTQGIDYSVEEFDAGATILVVLLTIGSGVALGLAMAATML